jgi:UDP-3-O-[3-hydroxymyristoyl] glucosamine N-acyltransferase
VRVEPTTLEFLARLAGGVVVGDATTTIRSAWPLADVQPQCVTLVEDAKRGHHAASLGAGAIVVREPIDGLSLPQLVVRDPHAAFAAIVTWFRPPCDRGPEGIHSSARIDPSALLGEQCAIAAGASIGAAVRVGSRCRIHANVVVMDGCVIGDEVTLMPGVVLYPNTVLEDRVWIHAGSVIGAFGFGYRTRQGVHTRAAQLGYAHIEQDVEVGACVTIDRGTYGTTRIGRGTKIDNQVMIAHNCQIGPNNLICSQVGIAGSCRTGEGVILAGQVGLKDHVTLGPRTIVGAQAGVMNDLDGDAVYLGSPATTQRTQMQIFASQQRLPEMRKTMKQLQQAIDGLQSQLVALSEADDPHAEPVKAA